jgi:hypothetical protein
MRAQRSHAVRVLAMSVLTLGLLVANTARAETVAPLPPEAEQAYRLGLLAADQQAYAIAIDQLRQAHTKARTDPRILYALGATEVKAGRLLQGLLWLSAALRAAPDAANADSLRGVIRGLHRDAAEEMERVFAAAQAAAALLPADTAPDKLLLIEEAQGRAGDLEGAELTAKAVAVLEEGSADAAPAFSEGYWENRARYHAALGQFADAEAAIAHLSTPAQAWAAVAVAALRRGDRQRAERALHEADVAVHRMQAEGHESAGVALNAMVTVARAYAAAGQEAAYRRMLAGATALTAGRDFDEDDVAELRETEAAGPDALRVGKESTRVGQWIDLAEFWEGNPDGALDVPTWLAAAKDEEDPAELVDALLGLASGLGEARLDLLTLDALHPNVSHLQAPAISASGPFQLRLVCADGTDGQSLSARQSPGGGTSPATVCVENAILLDQGDVKGVKVIRRKGEPAPWVEVTWTAQGKGRFARATEQAIGQELALVSQGAVFFHGKVRERVADPSFAFGPFFEADAKTLLQALAPVATPAAKPRGSGKTPRTPQKGGGQ